MIMLTFIPRQFPQRVLCASRQCFYPCRFPLNPSILSFFLEFQLRPKYPFSFYGAGDGRPPLLPLPISKRPKANDAMGP